MSKDSLAHKMFKASQRRKRVRKTLHGTAQRPRLSVHITNKQISAQIINDEAGKTLAHSSSVGQSQAAGALSAKAAWVGADIAKKAQKNKIKTVVFDRGAKRYHGRIKHLAEAARSGGLEF